MTTLFTNVEVEGRRCEVLLGPTSIEEVGERVSRSHVVEHIDGQGGALVPGLHDHHLHLLAMAAARLSVDCSDGMDALLSAPPGDWIRGVGAGVSMDRHDLDRIVADRPVRVQHRSGGLWMLNTRAIEAVRHALSGPGVERTGHGEPTGRLWRFDDQLRRALPDNSSAIKTSLDDLILEMNALGITSVTDATPDLDPATIELLRQLPLGVTLLGDPDSSAPGKIALHDHDLPDLGTLTRRIRIFHEEKRPVAVHCVTRESLFLTLAALEDAGRIPGDRIEHGAVIPREAIPTLRGLTVVTQPGMLVARSAYYRADVDPADRDHLYPFASLIKSGITVWSSSDAPYGPLDPWAGLRAARDRDLGVDERVGTEVAFNSLLLDSYGRQRRIAVGQPPAVLLLSTSLAHAMAEPDAAHVRLVRSMGR